MVLVDTRRPWSPLLQLQRLQGDFDRAFGGRTSGFPRVEIWAGEDGVVLVADVPGLRAEDVQVRVEQDVLTLRGELPSPTPAEGAELVLSERQRGAFERAFRLPFHADEVEARLRDGVLEVRVERPAAEKPRVIQVRSNEEA